MARILIVGGDELLSPTEAPRALALAQKLIGESHAVRLLGDKALLDAALERLCAEAADSAAGDGMDALGGIEICAGDPRRLASAHRALERVSLAFWLLGCADGSEAEVSALHNERLESFLGRLVDSSARGLVYEAAGTASAQLLASGSAFCADFTAHNALGFVSLSADPAERSLWIEQACGAVQAVLRN